MGERSETVLAVDVGNTETSLGLFSAGQLVGERSVTTPARLTTDEAAMDARAVLRELGAAGAVRGAILSCVVPTLTLAWERGLASACETRPLVVGPGLRSGLRLRFGDPSVWARTAWPTPWPPASATAPRWWR